MLASKSPRGFSRSGKAWGETCLDPVDVPALFASVRSVVDRYTSIAPWPTTLFDSGHSRRLLSTRY